MNAAGRLRVAMAATVLLSSGLREAAAPVRPSPQAAPRSLPRSPAATIPTEAEVVALHNARRAAHRLPPLTAERRLTAAARGQAADDARRRVDPYRGDLHRGSDGSTVGVRVARQGYPYRAASENAGWMPRGPLKPDGTPYFPIDAGKMMDLWMSSPGHRANVLGPYRDVGAAVAVDAAGDTYWIVTFGTPR